MENNWSFIIGTSLLTIIIGVIMITINLNTNPHEQQLLSVISTSKKKAVKIDQVIEFNSGYDIRYKYKTEDSNKRIPNNIIFNKEDIDDDLSIAFDEQVIDKSDDYAMIFFSLCLLVPLTIISFLVYFDVL